MKNKKRMLGSILFWIGLWVLVSRGIGKELVFPGLPRVASALKELLTTKDFYTTWLLSMGKIMSGYLLGILVGIALSIAAFRFSLVANLLHPAMTALKATPVAALTILLFFWMPASYLSVALVWIVVVPAIYDNCIKGLEGADPQLLEMAKVFSVPWNRVFRRIYWPSLVRFLIPGLNFTLGFAIKSGIAGEIIAQPRGSIGEAIYYSKIYLDTHLLFAWIIILVVSNLCLERILHQVLRRLERGCP